MNWCPELPAADIFGKSITTDYWVFISSFMYINITLWASGRNLRKYLYKVGLITSCSEKCPQNWTNLRFGIIIFAMVSVHTQPRHRFQWISGRWSNTFNTLQKWTKVWSQIIQFLDIALSGFPRHPELSPCICPIYQ